MGKVLIVDDQPAVRTALELLFEVNGIATVAVDSPEPVPELLAHEDIGLVIQDMNFHQARTDGAEGVALFQTIKKLDPDLPVLLMTAWTSLETAVALMKQGAADYFAKPWDDAKLVATVKNLLRLRDLAEENLRLRAQASRARRALERRGDLRGLIYASQAMHGVVSLAVSVAASDAPVMILGPNGSGKEKLAEIVQANSRRRDKPFVKVNAGGLPAELLEAELFGAEAGAFTGATKLRVGRFEAADGGTIFLDELGNLPLAGQAKLLRVLQTGEYERLGSSTTRRCDVRVVSATNADLPRLIAEGRFREDLLYRLNVIELYVPPLAERPEDILPLAEHFLTVHGGGAGAGGGGATPRRFSEAAIAALLAHEWPGNVRELQNRVQRATLVSTTPEITVADLGLASGRAARPSSPPPPAPPAPSRAPSAAPAAPAPPASPAPGESDGDDEAQRAAIQEALVRADGVVAKAAAELGLSRQALYRRMERLGIVLERRPRSA
jgi:DNA-binding NtrC family response regulator